MIIGYVPSTIKNHQVLLQGIQSWVRNVLTAHGDSNEGQVAKRLFYSSTVSVEGELRSPGGVLEGYSWEKWDISSP